jgi:replicative DNA helicase
VVDNKDFSTVLKEHFDIKNKIRPARAAIEKLHTEKQFLLRTGISYIDDSIIGLKKTDLLVIGSATNRGKTDIAKIIANNVADKDMNCLLFALESPSDEIEERLKWGEMQNIIHSDPKYKNLNLCYGLWSTSQYCEDTLVIDLEKEAINKIGDKTKDNLHIRYRVPSENYDVNVFCEEIEKAIREKTYSVIVIDHLHYFSKIFDNENRDIENIIKKLKDVSQLYQIPVVIFSHFRKKGVITTKIPDISEFHGSSEITKCATALIMIAPASDDFIKPAPYLYPTYFRTSKEKMKTGADAYAACILYNLKTGKYETQYDLFNYNSSIGEIYEITDKDYPAFAKNINKEPLKKKQSNTKDGKIKKITETFNNVFSERKDLF